MKYRTVLFLITVFTILGIPRMFAAIEGNFGYVTVDGIKYFVSNGGSDNSQATVVDADDNLTVANILSSLTVTFHYSVPDTFVIRTCVVNVIDKDAFSNNEKLTSVNIPNTVTDIEYAFQGCTGLTSIDIPNSVINLIGAFAGCTGLTSICIPNSVRNITGAFAGCTGLTSVDIPNSVTFIGTAAFEDCLSLQHVSIGRSVASIDNGAFRNCPALTSISFYGCSPRISIYAFYETYHINEVNITDLSAWCKVTYGDKFNDMDPEPNPFGGRLYLNGEEIKNLVIPDDIVKINNSAFHSCYSLESVVFPNSVKSIGEKAFQYCNNLKYVDFCDSLVYIKKDAFSYCPIIGDLVFPDTLVDIGANAFRGCKNISIVKIPNSVKAIHDRAFLGSGITTLFLSDSIKEIGGEAFCGCSKLTNIYSYINKPNNVYLGPIDDWLGGEEDSPIWGAYGVFYCYYPDYSEVSYIYDNCILHVPKGTINLYKNLTPWKYFSNIEEMDDAIIGDLDCSGIVDVEDVNAAINIILKLNNITDYQGNGDMNGDGIIDVEDVNAIINVILKLN